MYTIGIFVLGDIIYVRNSTSASALVRITSGW